MSGGNLLTMQNYFTVNGEKYYTGTVFIVNNVGQQTEASFVCYSNEHKRYVYKTRDHTWFADEKTFYNRFVGLTVKVDNTITMPIVKTKSDMQIDGLFIGWTWYISLMVASAIFKDAIGLWVLISVIFFTWRSEKIKKEGTYIEW